MAGLVQNIKDPMLAQLVQEIEAKLDPRIKDGYHAIVVAGMKILFSDQTHHLLTIAVQKMKAAGPSSISPGVAQIAVGLIALIHKESRGAMQTPAAFAAVLTLMAYVFDFLESVGLPADANTVAATTQLTMQQLLKLFNISPDQLKQGALDNQSNAAPAPSPMPAPGASPMPPTGVPS